ncbi:hypothetical protein CYMTET_7351 [Cymbomonas tetramitiformis]|uniref:Reverse transcriptase Ty1/copia-type domain-containing protein n=1 Tax=Cymbomonas tetramitiformis TaxID=36881 RepID=A0AAE0GV62_9CHLO|nr:hypothetical protein CYMTET_7351 [Cymbomonas tetramitiformis]
MDGVTAPGRAELIREFPKNIKVLPTKLVCKLKKNTDGTIDKFKSAHDECLYIGNLNAHFMMVLIYVDDFVIACANELIEATFHDKLMSTFTTTYSGVPNQFLQLKIDIDTTIDATGNAVPVKIGISNKCSIEHLVNQFNINTTKQPPLSPMTEGLSITAPSANNIVKSLERPLRSLVYSLLCGLTRTIRPDVYYHVAVKLPCG